MQKKLVFAIGEVFPLQRLFSRSNLLFLMKVNMISVLLVFLAFNIMASSSSAQSIYDTQISIEFKKETLKAALQKLQTATGYTIFYPSEKIEQSKVKTLKMDMRTISDVLDLLLKDTNLQYNQNGENIILFETPLIADKEDGIQSLEISGIIRDENGQPLPGVSISIKNWKDLPKNVQTSTATDVNGHFKIIVPNKETILVFKFIGFIALEKTVGEVRSFDIKLEPDVATLQDVVVTGIFSQTKSTFTGAAKTFDAQELAKVSNNSVLSALASLDPSFQLPENLLAGSNPNVLPDVVLRGGNTLVDTRQVGTPDPFNYQASPNAPLFILDGFETTLQRINDLDMNRISSVTILKDAGATAIYGSRGANGVIVIEQIRPIEGKLLFSYNASTTIESPDLNGYDLLNSKEKFELEDRSGFFDGHFNTTQNNFDLIRESRQAAVSSGVNTDWIAKPLRTGIGQKHNLNIEGGAESVTYGLSLSYDQNTGVMKGSDRTNTTGNSFLSYRLNNFQFRNDLTLSFNNGNNSPYGSFQQYTRLNPYWSPYDTNGALQVYLEDVIDPATGLRVTNVDYYDNLNGYIGRPVNPLFNASLNITDRTNSRGITNNFETRWQAKDWLRVTGRLSYLKQNDESDIFLPAQHSSFSKVTTFEKGSYTKGTGDMQSIEGFLTAEANKNFGKHFISASGTLNAREVSYNTQSIRVIGFPNPNLDQLILGNQYPANTKPTGSESLNRSLGTLLRGAYAYDNRYLFDVTYRLDGSSLFGSDKRYAPFWSIGTGWNLTNEEFLKENSIINEARLRYTIGTTGSQSFESYKGITTSQYYTDREYRGIITSYLLGFGNSSLAWQKTLKQNIGIDITLFNRFNLSANYFIERSKGSIAFISSTPSSGFTGYYDNMGDVVNEGYELYGRFNIIANPTSRKNLSVFVNAFHVSNKIEKISSTIEALNDKANTTNSTIPLPKYAEGQSVNVIWGVQSLGIDPASGAELFRARDGSVTNRYNPADQIIVGDMTSTLKGTLGTNLELGGIGLNLYLRFDFGGDTYNQTLVDRVENVNVSNYNVDRRVLEQRWVNPGDISFYRGIVDYNLTVAQPITYATSRFVQKNNFIAGESASVYYRFSDEFNKKLGLRNTKITFFGNDLFRAASIKRERGVDYPFAHNFTLQLQTTF